MAEPYTRVPARTLLFALAGLGLTTTLAWAAPDFSRSTITHEPAAPIEGDVITFRITLRNAGDEPAEPAIIQVEWPVMGFMVGTSGIEDASIDPASRHLDASTPLAVGEERRFEVRVLTPRDSAGDNFSVRVKASHYPSQTDEWLHHSVSPDSRLSRDGLAVGGMRVNPVAFVVLGFLAAGMVLAILAARGRRERGVGAAFAIIVSLGFWSIFGAMAWRDYQSLTTWVGTTCTVVGRRIDATTTSSSSRSSSQAPGTNAVYEPLLALEYDVNGRVEVSSGYDTGSRLRVGGFEARNRELAAWTEGSRVPCWYDPADPADVVVHRGFGGAYVFALFPVPVFLIGVAMLRSRRA